MVQQLNPQQIAAPVGPYSQGVLASGAGKWLHIAGQVGMRKDGSLGQGMAEQADLAWSNLREVLRAADLDIADLVKVVTYVTDETQLAALAPVRLKYLGETRPASTLVAVKALARPEWLFEVEAVAYRAV